MAEEDSDVVTDSNDHLSFSSRLGERDRGRQSQARLAPPDTQTNGQEAESCKVVGVINCLQLQHTHGRLDSLYGQSVVEVGAASWRITFCSSATFSTTLPLSLYSESGGLA